MPGSDDDNDFLQTYNKSGAGKSKTNQIAPAQLSRTNAQTDIPNAGSLSTADFNNATTPDATGSAVKSAIENASQGEVIIVYGDFTMSNTANWDTDRVAFIHRGQITLDADFMTVGDNSRANIPYVDVGHIDGQDLSQNRAFARVHDSKFGVWKFNGQVVDVDMPVQFHANASGTEVNSHRVEFGEHAMGVNKAVEVRAESGNAEGYNITGGNIQASDKTIHVHGTAGNNLGTLTWIGGTLHGSAASRNTHEIHLESPASKCMFFPKFLGNPEFHSVTGSGQVVFNDSSSGGIYQNTWLNGMINFDLETQNVWQRIRDSGGTPREVMREAATDGIDIVAMNAAPGGAGGNLRLDADNKVEVIGNGAQQFQVDTSAGSVDLFGNSLTNVGSLNINPTNTYSPTNDTTDRAFDANNTTVAELADVLATLIKDLGLDA